MIVSSRSQIKTRSGGFGVSGLPAVSDPTLLVGLGWACRRPRALPVLLGVLLADVFVFGDIERGECGE